MATIADLKLKPAAYFLDIRSNLGFTADAFAAALANELDPQRENISFAYARAPFDAAIEELLSPLYADATSPLRAGDQVRAAWQQPIPISDNVTLSPETLAQAFANLVPTSVAAGLLAESLGFMLVGDSQSIVLIPDVERTLIDLTVARKVLPVEVCIALRLRADLGEQHIVDPYACQSIQLLIDQKITDAAAIAALIATATINPAKS